MGKLLRRVRGLLGMGLTWGVLWAGIGAAVGLVLRIGSHFIIVDPILEWSLGMGVYGFVSGVGFGKILWLREGRKSLDQISLRRVALWGAIGAGLVPAVFALLGVGWPSSSLVGIAEAMLLTGALGGTFAAGSVAIAKRAELSAPEGRKLLE
jgi:hypothetical protein